MAKMQCDVLIIERELYSGEVDHVVLPAASGEMGVYAGHEPMIVMLKSGVVRVVESPEQQSNPIRILINDGYASIGARGVQIICQRAETVEGIDSLDRKKISVEIDNLQEKLAELSEEDPNAAYLSEEVAWRKMMLEYNE